MITETKGFFSKVDCSIQLVTDQVMYNTRGSYGADFHAMFQNNLLLVQVGFLSENEGFNVYGVARLDLGERRGFTFNVSALFNWGFGVARAPFIDPDDPAEVRPGSQRLDRLRYGLAANARWKGLDVYGAVIWDRVYGLPRELDRVFDRNAAGLTLEVDYLVHEHIMLSTRFDQLWAGGLKDKKRDGTIVSAQIRYYPWPNIAFFSPVPVLTALFGILEWRAIADRKAELSPFVYAVLLFSLSYLGIAISLFPMIVPHHYTLWQAASSPDTQIFLGVGTLFLLPVILVYTGWSYWVFRGKVRADTGYH
jgi:hypothetical protein